MGATVESGGTNFIARAAMAQFAFPATIQAMGDEITLYAADWDSAKTAGPAAIKGEMQRDANGTVGIRTLAFAYPVTALSRDGNLYAIVQMAFEQDAAVGLLFTADTATIGSFAFEKGTYDPNSTSQAFEGNAAQTLHSALLEATEFRIELMVAGQTYSAMTASGTAYRRFIADKLLPAMDEAGSKDATAPCYGYTSEEMDELYGDCFLTTACCGVVGLPDDCWELATLRRFRDGWMMRFAEGRAEVERYYREAPAVAQRLVASAAGRRRLLGLYWSTIVPSALLARLGLNRLAYARYRRMMLDLLPG